MTLPPQVLSPLDGRYREAAEPLGEYLSEAGLNRARCRVEVEWIIFLAAHTLLGATPLTAEQQSALRQRVTNFGRPTRRA